MARKRTSAPAASRRRLVEPKKVPTPTGASKGVLGAPPVRRQPASTRHGVLSPDCKKLYQEIMEQHSPAFRDSLARLNPRRAAAFYLLRVKTMEDYVATYIHALAAYE